MKLIIAITGATGAIFGVRMLELLRDTEIETHLVLSPYATQTIKLETKYNIKEVEEMADYVHAYKDLGAKISSGSFLVDGMIIAPCSMKTLSSVRIGLADNLISRAADVMLKENKKLLLMTRETPLSTIHLENMLYLSKMGAKIFPPMPAFYNLPESIEDIVDHLVYRCFDQFDIHIEATKRWQGLNHK